MVGEIEARHLDKRAQPPSRIRFEVLILDSIGSCQDSRIDGLKRLCREITRKDCDFELDSGEQAGRQAIRVRKLSGQHANSARDDGIMLHR